MPTSVAPRLYLGEPEEQRRVESIDEARHVIAPAGSGTSGSRGAEGGGDRLELAARQDES
jgi:hypothetical protein